MRYFVTIGERTLEVDLSGGQPSIDGVPVQARLETIPGTRVRHLLLGSESYLVIAENGARAGLWHLTLRGRTLSAEVIDERTRTIREMAGGEAVDAPKVIAAPMPGLVVRIAVEVGQRVSAGEGVIVVEAMKMENELKAPAEGVVAKIEVAPGQPVEKGAVLVIME